MCRALYLLYIVLFERDNHQQESTVRFPLPYVVTNVTSDDCITSITYAISYLFNNKSRSISNTLGKINRIPFLCKAKTLRAFFCNSLSNRPSTLTGFL